MYMWMNISIVTIKVAMCSRGMRGQGKSWWQRGRNKNAVRYSVFVCGILKVSKFEIKN